MFIVGSQPAGLVRYRVRVHRLLEDFMESALDLPKLWLGCQRFGEKLSPDASADRSRRLVLMHNPTPPVHIGTLDCVATLRLYKKDEDLPDLAPEIYRQRLVVEGYCSRPITADQIETYLRTLSVVCGMTRLNDPVTHSSERYGWAGWVHWEASGAHMYAWDYPMLFFSVDIYTCAAFDETKVTEFTSAFFDSTEVVAKGF